MLKNFLNHKTVLIKINVNIECVMVSWVHFHLMKKIQNKKQLMTCSTKKLSSFAQLQFYFSETIEYKELLSSMPWAKCGDKFWCVPSLFFFFHYYLIVNLTLNIPLLDFLKISIRIHKLSQHAFAFSLNIWF